MLVGFEFVFIPFLVRNRTYQQKRSKSTFSPLSDVFIVYRYLQKLYRTLANGAAPKHFLFFNFVKVKEVILFQISQYSHYKI